MVKSLYEHLFAGLLCAALALGAFTASPVKAGMSDEEVVTGLLALLFLGVAIDNRRDRNEATRAQAARENAVRPAPDRPSRWFEADRTLPAICLRTWETRLGDTIRIFGQRCLEREYRNSTALPADCYTHIRLANGQRRQGYLVRCLREHGYRVSRR